MKKKKVFVHIGYEKTGTTTLQKHYLPHIEGVFYLGRHYAPEGGIKFSGYEEVLGAGDRLFDDEFVEGVREKFSESLFWENSSSEIFLLSNELFTGRFVHPASMNDLHRSVTSPNKVIELLQKLFSEEFFDLYFIITIRRQYDILASRYAQSYQYFRKEFRECLFFRSFEEFKESVAGRASKISNITGQQPTRQVVYFHFVIPSIFYAAFNRLSVRFTICMAISSTFC